MLALHARRSAPAIAAWRAARPQAPLVVVLTGTDLYHDIAQAQIQAQAEPAAPAGAAQPEVLASLAQADRLVVLNTLGAQAVPEAHRHKVRVVLQSSSARAVLGKSTRSLRALMVGHLRAEKDPHTYWQAARLLAPRSDISLDHIGAPLDPALGDAARALMAEQPRYRWLGGCPHEATRRRIQRAQLLVHPSRLEGGAHVVIEALRSGTAVLASRVDGNLGLLGPHHPGLFEPGDAAGLAALLRACRDDPAMLPALQAAGAALAPRFAPEAEAQALHAVLAELLCS